MPFSSLKKGFQQGLQANSFKDLYKQLSKAKENERTNFGCWVVKEMTKPGNFSDKKNVLIFKLIDASLKTMKTKNKAIVSLIKSINPSSCASSVREDIFRCVRRLRVSINIKGSKVISNLERAIHKMPPKEAYFLIKSNHFENVLPGTSLLKTIREKVKDVKYIDYAIEINKGKKSFFEFIKGKKIKINNCRKILPFLTHADFRNSPKEGFDRVF